MPTPQALCIENLMAPSDMDRYTVCVAVPGNEPGLGLDRRGKVQWQKRKVTGCELWISADDRLMLFRPDGAAPVTVHREGRFLDAPYEKPVVLLDQDEVEVGSKRFRLHFHGETPEVFAPEPYPLRDAGVGRVVRATAAALAIGVASGGAGCGSEQPEPPPRGQVEEPEPVVDKTKVPKLAPPPKRLDAGAVAPAEQDAGAAPAVKADAGQDTDNEKKKKKEKKKIEVRKRPPAPPRFKDKDGFEL